MTPLNVMWGWNLQIRLWRGVPLEGLIQNFPFIRRRPFVWGRGVNHQFLVWTCLHIKGYVFEFSVNVFTEFSDKKNIILKRFLCSNPLSPVWETETTVPQRCRWQKRQLNWSEFMLQWFPEFAPFREHSIIYSVQISEWGQSHRAPLNNLDHTWRWDGPWVVHRPSPSMILNNQHLKTKETRFSMNITLTCQLDGHLQK